jgi:hypothetical protein
MTFALKDFETLKKHFNETVETILRREKKESIDELPTKRKEELLFLNSVLTELDARITGSNIISSNPKNLKPFAEIFYGAMSVIKKDIIANLGWGEKAENSLLYTSLDEIMGITEQNVPSNHQYVHFYNVLNNGFLPLIFKDGNSRLGLKSPNALDSVPTDKLATLIITSYQLEESARNEITKNLGTEGKEVSANSYKVARDTPATALAGFTTLSILTEALDSLIIDERADKNVPKVSSLTNKDRAAQIQSVKVVADTLSDPKMKAIKESERIAILAGMMLLVNE